MLQRFFAGLILSLTVVLAACRIAIPTSSNTTHPTPTTTTISVFIVSTASVTSTVAKYHPFQSLLTQVVSGPVYVTGDQSVPRAALDTANGILQVMLQHRPDVVVSLRKQGAFTAVSSRTEKICDLPYFRQYDNSLCQQFGEGGAGGIPDHPITACDEKNLLAESDDPYLRGTVPYGQNICVHELAHTIMDVGLSQADRGRIYQRFLAAKQERRWGAGDYAMSNEMEFWAVMSQFYFSAGPSEPYSPTFTSVANSPDALKQADPATFMLLDSIYHGSANLQ